MKELIKVSFPGLGIEPFTLNKIAFSIGSLEVRWYGILITLGIALAFAYAFFRGKRNEGIVPDDIIDIGLVTVLMGVLGARLYYVLTTLDEGGYNSFYDVIAIWNGGLGIYGGIIGGCLGIFLACKWKKLDWKKAFDMIGPGVMLAQAIGRWGNFFNGEAHGYAVGSRTYFYFMGKEHVLNVSESSLFYKLRMGLNPNPDAPLSRMNFYHPTFLYECLWNLLGFVLINIFYKHKKFNGQVALMYFVWYGFGRMFIEGFRTDSLFIPGTDLRISQCIGLACFTVGVILLIAIPVYRRFKPALAGVSEEAPVEDSEPLPTTEETTPESIQELDLTNENNETADEAAKTYGADEEEENNGKID